MGAGDWVLKSTCSLNTLMMMSSLVDSCGCTGAMWSMATHPPLGVVYAFAAGFLTCFSLHLSSIIPPSSLPPSLPSCLPLLSSLSSRPPLRVAPSLSLSRSLVSTVSPPADAADVHRADAAGRHHGAQVPLQLPRLPPSLHMTHRG